LCVAVDQNGNALIYNGQTWSSPASVDSNGQLASVSCVAGITFCMAVDESGDVLTYDGSWSAPQVVDSSGYFTSVSCVSASFCVSVDANGNDYIDNGGNWSSTNLTSAEVSTVSCSGTFCAAGDYGGRAYTYSNGSWSGPNTVDTSIFESISCASASFCLASDGNSEVLTLSDGSWSSPVAVDHPQGYLNTVSCATARFCVAADFSGNGTYWNGSTWTAPQAATNQFLTDVSCASTTFCVGVNPNGATTYNDASWTAVEPIATRSSVEQVSCIPNGAQYFCAALSSNGTSSYGVVYNGSSWVNQTTIGPANVGLDSGISCLSPTFCVGSGGGGSSGYAIFYNGSTWTTSVVTSSSLLLGISCTSSTFCVAIDESSHAYVYNGHTWTRDNLGATMSSISCASASFCAGVGYNGESVTFNGTSWSTPVTIDAGGNFASYDDRVSCVSSQSSDFCAAADDTANVLTYGTPPPSTCSPTTGYPSCTISGQASVGAGALTLEAPGTMSWSTRLLGANMTLDDQLTLTPVDSTGSGNGWNVSALSTPFTRTSPTTAVIAYPALSLNGDSSGAVGTDAPADAGCAAGSSCTAPVDATSGYPIAIPDASSGSLDTPVVIYSAIHGSGIGATDLTADWWLSVPAATGAGTYTSTITLTISSGP